jgi:2-desacetyl-2-hydroxyethyl bacteriochlorophyllide A dehydrogenase
MRSLVLTAPHTLEVLERDPVPLAAGEVRLAVEATGICGSDVHGYAGLNDRRPVGVIMGHESVGRVVEAAPGVDLAVGTRVVVNPVVSCGECRACREGRDNLCANRRIYGCVVALPGALATEFVVPAANCVPVDPAVDVRSLALSEPMAVGMHGVRLGGVAAGDRVLIVGGGPIGMAVVLGCLDAGATPIVCEPQQARREAAERLGAESCDPAELPGLRLEGDIAFECVGLSATVKTAVGGVRPGGTIVCLGVGEAEVAVPVVPLVIEERRILGSSAYTARDFRETVVAVTARADVLAGLVGLTVDLDQMPRVFEDYHAGRLSAMKTLYVPGS